MTYYEELGLTPSASTGDIRKAHRTVSRLLHPDQQTEQALRQAAELQMRRLNAVVAILLDPQQRRKYDDSLRPPRRDPQPPVNPAPRPGWAPFSVLDLIGIVAAAVLVTLGAIWFFAGDFIPSKGQVPERPVAARVLPVSGRAQLSEDPGKSPRPPQLSPLALPPPRPASKPRIAVLPRQDDPTLFSKSPDETPIEIAPDPFQRSPLATPPGLALSMPPPEATLIADAPPPAATSFIGLWLLPSFGREHLSSSRMRQTPRYIQISLHRGPNDTIYGEYSARYQVPDRPISPEVAFTFEGPVTGNSAAFDWDATDGSTGAIELKLLNPHSMQVNWHVAKFGTRIGIAGGAAVVIRTGSH